MSADGRVLGAVLAAGAGRRFGGDKLVAPLDGEPLVAHAVRALRDSGACEAIAAAVRDTDDPVALALGARDVRCVVARGADEGMSASVRTLAALAASEGFDALLVALGDQPHIEHGVVARVVARWRSATPRPLIVAPTYRGTRGHPVLFAAPLFAELQAVRGDAGARGVIRAHAGQSSLVPVDVDPPRDVDTQDDLRALTTPF